MVLEAPCCTPGLKMITRCKSKSHYTSLGAQEPPPAGNCSGATAEPRAASRAHAPLILPRPIWSSKALVQKTGGGGHSVLFMFKATRQSRRWCDMNVKEEGEWVDVNQGRRINGRRRMKSSSIHWEYSPGPFAALPPFILLFQKVLKLKVASLTRFN